MEVVVGFLFILPLGFLFLQFIWPDFLPGLLEAIYFNLTGWPFEEQVIYEAYTEDIEEEAREKVYTKEPSPAQPSGKVEEENASGAICWASNEGEFIEIKSKEWDKF